MVQLDRIKHHFFIDFYEHQARNEKKLKDIFEDLI